jgi:thermitase
MAVATVALGWPTPAMAATPNDPFYARQWYLRRIGVPDAWKTTQGKGVTIAIIDTGVDRQHEDLKAQLVKAQYDSVSGDNFAQDSAGHGTLAAGVAAAATNNKLGIAGVAPKAKIMAVRAFPLFNEAEGTSGAAVLDAIMWATDNGANVINLSLSALVPGEDTVLGVTYAIANGVLVVASAGNTGLPLCRFPGGHPGAVCVGASDQLDGIASFSNYGLGLDVVAPGTAIWSTGAMHGAGATTGKYSAPNGTSFAAPMVAGVGALLMGMGADNITASMILRLSSKDLGLPGYDLTYGFGRVDAREAVAMCKELC